MTGATGVVGVGLVRELIAKNHRVKILARSDVEPSLFGKTVEIVRGDVADETAIEAAAKNVEWIFHLAAKLHVNNPNVDLKSEYEQTNVEGTRRLLAAAHSNSVEKFIFFSTINVYGASQAGSVFDETSRLKPEGFYAESKAAAEELVLQENFGVVLRLAAVYGSRMKGNYVRLLEALRRERFFFVGGGTNRRTLVHQSDAAQAAILAAEKSAGGEIYNVTDGEIHTLREIVAAICANLDKKPPSLNLPAAPLRFAVGAAEDIAQIIGLNSPIKRALLEKFLEDVAVGGDKIQREIGFRPRFDSNSGWREAIARSAE